MKAQSSNTVWEQVEGKQTPAPAPVPGADERKRHRRRCVLVVILAVIGAVLLAFASMVIYEHIRFPQTVYVNGEKTEGIHAFRMGGVLTGEGFYVSLRDSLQEAGYDVTDTDEGGFAIESNGITYVFDLNDFTVKDEKGNRIQQISGAFAGGRLPYGERRGDDVFGLDLIYENVFKSLHLSAVYEIEEWDGKTVRLTRYEPDTETPDALLDALLDGDYDRLASLAAAHPEAATGTPGPKPGWWVVSHEELLRGGPTSQYIAFLPPLHRACLLGDAEAVRILLDNGADMNAPALYGDDTPLEVCLRSYAEGRYETANLLLDRGAKPFITHTLPYLHIPLEDDTLYRSVGILTGGGATEADFALFDRLCEAAAPLSYNFGNVLNQAIRHGCIPAVKTVLRVNPDALNQPLVDEYGYHYAESPLLRAVETDAGFAMVYELVSAGADKTIKDKNGKTAYDLAVARGDSDAARIVRP